MGLLAWSPEPGDEGLLLFPGEQDDVTKDKERQKKKKNKAKIMLLGLGTFVTQPFQHMRFPDGIPKGHPYPPPICPPSTARPTPQPILGGALIPSALCSPGPQSSVAGSGSPRLAKCRGQMPKIILRWDTPWAGGERTRKLRKGRGSGESEPESRGTCQNPAF